MCPSLSTCLFVLATLTAACSGPAIDLTQWRAREARPRPAAERGAVESEIAVVEHARAADQLDTARRLALTLAAEHVDEARLLSLASRAESDGLFLLDEGDKEARNHAAASALDYAQRAADFGAQRAEDRAQFAWALGTTTHLQPMFDRSSHAARTIATAQAALELQPDEATALATLAIVNLRLETLPWIASVMAIGRPESSLEEAQHYARSACESRPSRENRLILAKVLVAAEKPDQARQELTSALAAPIQFPRDTVLEKSLRALLGELAP